jgi:hypothetical protein
MGKMKTLAIPEQQRYGIISILEDENKKLQEEIWKLKKDVCYWQESCQNISEEAYEEHLEKGSSM